ncbi:MAG TPA: hypothetical protein HPQ00_01190, partial [Magnetococcales bacterium]|nr:hypothetical protein [Magnetococcales bacterium]
NLYKAMERPPEKTNYIPMPEGLAAKFQNYTQADIAILRSIPGLSFEPMTLEQGIAAFVQAKKEGL